MSEFAHLAARLDPNQGCTKDTCPVTDSVYGYSPDLGATIFFLILFAVSGLIHTWQGIRTKTWFFATSMVIGCISESLGYIAKLMLNNDPFSQTGFILSVVVLTFAPAFYAAGIYYTLKHICLTFSPTLSRLPPAWYTYAFISCDFLSILLQAVGGALASASETDAVLKIGDNVTIAGLTTQVFTLLVFGVLVVDYAWTVRKHSASLNANTAVLRSSMQFRLFLVALTVAYFAILIRCCYRVAELAHGWGPQNSILRTQGLFIGLDSVPIGLTTVILNIWHPGWCFPRHHQDTAFLASSAKDSTLSQEMSSTDDEVEKGGFESA